jgi:hypothetical protein
LVAINSNPSEKSVGHPLNPDPRRKRRLNQSARYAKQNDPKCANDAARNPVMWHFPACDIVATMPQRHGAQLQQDRVSVVGTFQQMFQPVNLLLETFRIGWRELLVGWKLA